MSLQLTACRKSAFCIWLLGEKPRALCADSNVPRTDLLASIAIASEDDCTSSSVLNADLAISATGLSAPLAFPDDTAEAYSWRDERKQSMEKLEEPIYVFSDAQVVSGLLVRKVEKCWSFLHTNKCSIQLTSGGHIICIFVWIVFNSTWQPFLGFGTKMTIMIVIIWIILLRTQVPTTTIPIP